MIDQSGWVLMPAMLVQDGGQSLSSGTLQEAAPGGDATGGGAPTGPAAPGGSGTPFFMLMILGMVVFMIFTSMMSSKKEKKRRAALLSGIKRSDTVQTVGGVIGRVVEIKDDEVTLLTDKSSNTRIRFARSSVQQVLKSGTSGNDTGETTDDESVKEIETATI